MDHRTVIPRCLASLSFLHLAIPHILPKELVLEKESRIRETMKMMGLSQWILWTTWYAKQLLFLLVPVIVMSIILKVSVKGLEQTLLVDAIFIESFCSPPMCLARECLSPKRRLSAVCIPCAVHHLGNIVLLLYQVSSPFSCYNV